ncbi:hypothetical protein JCM10207_000497 [Rhodosporidiobolus poonsookiae]
MAALAPPTYVRLDSAATLLNSEDDAGSEKEEHKPFAGERVAEQQASHDANFRLMQLWSRSHQRRQLQYFVILLAISLLTLLRVNGLTPTSLRLSRATKEFLPTYLPTVLSTLRPDTAPSGSLYQSCDAESFLDAVARSKLRPDGASRKIDSAPVEHVEATPIEFSFDFPEDSACAQPRVYSREEACELLSSFGGIYTIGDSYMRHINSALLILLRGRLDGSVVDYLTSTDCRGDHMFIENKSCRMRVPIDTITMQSDTMLVKTEPLCGGRVHLRYLHRWDVPGAYATDVADYVAWRGTLPAEMQRKSTIYLQSWGVHFNYQFPLVMPWLDLFARWSWTHTWPRPLSLILGPHHPPANQSAQFVPTQGPIPARRFTDEMARYVPEANLPRGVQASEGATAFMDLMEATNGAASADGAHLAYQANMEKVHLILNYLDILHGDVSRQGGIVTAAPSPDPDLAE